jgi:hypothetical protein
MATPSSCPSHPCTRLGPSLSYQDVDHEHMPGLFRGCHLSEPALDADTGTAMSLITRESDQVASLDDKNEGSRFLLCIEHVL